MRPIPYGRQSISSADIQAVTKILKSDWITQGPTITAFEEKLAKYCGAQFAVAVSSATAGLHIACLAAGCQAGDESITSPITFLASANCMAYCGGRPRFADIDPITYNLSPDELEYVVNRQTKIVIPVHFAGQSCDMAEIQKIIEDKTKRFGRRIFIVEDASHALGSDYLHKKVGSCTYSDMTVFSFHPVKHITTGEGGAVLTNDPQLYKCLKRLRSHGVAMMPEDFIGLQGHRPSIFDPKEEAPWYYEQQELGFNYRMTDIQAALGISQLKMIEKFKQRRRAIVQQYNKAFADISWIKTPVEKEGRDSNFHLYVARFDFPQMKVTRGAVMNRLRAAGVYTQVHYTPVYTQPYYRKTFGTRWGDCPQAEHYYFECLSLPLFPAMKDADVKYVIEQIKSLN